jgi:hypothetical protein
MEATESSFAPPPQLLPQYVHKLRKGVQVAKVLQYSYNRRTESDDSEEKAYC